MDSLEKRNLNRLKNGKMMLEYSQVKKGWGLAFALTVFFGWTGVHRYYLGYKKTAVFILIITILASILLIFGDEASRQTKNMTLFVVVCLQVFLFLEIILSFWVTTRVNNRIKNNLKMKYGVQDYDD